MQIKSCQIQLWPEIRQVHSLKVPCKTSQGCHSHEICACTSPRKSRVHIKWTWLELLLPAAARCMLRKGPGVLIDFHARACDAPSLCGLGERGAEGVCSRGDGGAPLHHQWQVPPVGRTGPRVSRAGPCKGLTQSEHLCQSTNRFLRKRFEA